MWRRLKRWWRGRRWWSPCTGWRTTTPHLLEVTVHVRHPLLYGLYLLHPLLLILITALIQLHIPPVGLLELPLHWRIKCMDLITDGLCIGSSRPNSRSRAWRIWPAVGGTHPVNPPLVVAADRLGRCLIVVNKWAVGVLLSPCCYYYDLASVNC